MKQKKSKRGLIVYDENPSILKIRTGQKPRPLTRANKAWVSEDTGEYYDKAGLWEVQEVDDAKFVKLYAGGISTFCDLSRTGQKTCEMVLNELSNNPNADSVFLNVNVAEEYKISSAVFYRGLKELCEKEVLFESSKGQGWYFINVQFIFNGDRLFSVKEYRRKRSNKNFNDPNQLKLFDTNKQADIEDFIND